MLKTLFTVLAALGAAVTVSAQVAMDLTLNRSTFMQYEPVYACVTLRNDSGRPLLFGKRAELQGFLLFEITDQRGKPVPKRPGSDLTVTGLVLEPGQTRQLIVPINRYYQIDPAGIYRVHAYISHSLLPSEYKSPDLKFNIEPGITVWKKAVGLPDLHETEAPTVSKERVYSIRSVTDNATKAFYLVIEDDKMIYSVIRVGKAIGYEKFTAEVDMLSRLHLLMPIAPKVFHYLAFSPSGSKFADEYRKTSGTIPMLMRNPDTGMVTLIGGETARAGVDFSDPNAGLVRVAELDGADTGDGTTPPGPEPTKDKGLVDLGRDL